MTLYEYNMCYSAYCYMFRLQLAIFGEITETKEFSFWYSYIQWEFHVVFLI